MKGTISRLLEAYENGKMSRRALIQGLALLAAGAGTAEAAGFQGNSINHVSLYVSNLQRSTDFYQRVFGCTVNKRDGNNQLMFGKDFLVLRPGNPPGKVDHFAIGVDNFNKDSVTADLKAREPLRFTSREATSVSMSWTRTDSPCKLARTIRNGRAPFQNSSRSANWIWRSRVEVSRMTAAEPAMSRPEKTISSGCEKFA